MIYAPKLYKTGRVLQRFNPLELRLRLFIIDGGGGGIRTHDGLSPMPVFKTGAFNRSATPPGAA